MGDASGSNIIIIIIGLKASISPQWGPWLQVLPSFQFGTMLDNDSLRIAVELRVGAKFMCSIAAYAK